MLLLEDRTKQCARLTAPSFPRRRGRFRLPSTERAPLIDGSRKRPLRSTTNPDHGLRAAPQELVAICPCARMTAVKPPRGLMQRFRRASPHPKPGPSLAVISCAVRPQCGSLHQIPPLPAQGYGPSSRVRWSERPQTSTMAKGSPALVISPSQKIRQLTEPLGPLGPLGPLSHSVPCAVLLPARRFGQRCVAQQRARPWLW